MSRGRVQDEAHLRRDGAAAWPASPPASSAPSGLISVAQAGLRRDGRGAEGDGADGRRAQVDGQGGQGLGQAGRRPGRVADDDLGRRRRGDPVGRERPAHLHATSATRRARATRSSTRRRRRRWICRWRWTRTCPSSAIQVGKALNDPIKGVTALRRVGVQFTDAQTGSDQGAGRAGKKLEAQKIILTRAAGGVRRLGARRPARRCPAS